MDTTARHLFIIPPTPQATRPVQLRCRQRRKLHLSAISTRGHGYAGRRIATGRARKSRNEISVACNAIMSVQYVILYDIVGPTVGDSTAMYAPPLRYKGEALAAHARRPGLSEVSLDSLETRSTLSKHKLGFTPKNPVLNLLRAQAIQHTVDVGYYAPAARTTLNLLCSTCSCI